MVYNPSLREEPIDQPAAVIPTKHETSILDWLESTGRLLARDEVPAQDYAEEGEDIDGLIVDDVPYDDDFDDDDMGDLDEEV
ncbi:hypothetical protein NIES2119_04680 [[Phormidium ambiguum] IAM M-71]|uniref:DUF3134 domain-containing protein n=1 Tax=[Phormidium ambiguum] IAM M-71 TaxID=454136 RepID=A0A1U7IS46_9CYAN|nr:DUF3134 domain-containing protein [Phormidium ambiguum]OKH40215.1 hypothetical protein NIES2119_04680 [Phormidium ambiguum IAM M-71]